MYTCVKALKNIDVKEKKKEKKEKQGGKNVKSQEMSNKVSDDVPNEFYEFNTS
ncbi:hypothetical protein WN51_07069 [Melipona quadrifasciata]|uniref:Uncharacterized protein n=1 Tax=Melipona quadrifasciata TaxID=166423 RepID=A0A0N0BC10_9HYME|nr:hypothetical protein WN51_07069 [Melipona quadrifasciata]